jgi:hypothetical protein
MSILPRPPFTLVRLALLCLLVVCSACSTAQPPTTAAEAQAQLTGTWRLRRLTEINPDQSRYERDFTTTVAEFATDGSFRISVQDVGRQGGLFAFDGPAAATFTYMNYSGEVLTRRTYRVDLRGDTLILTEDRGAEENDPYQLESVYERAW